MRLFSQYFYRISASNAISAPLTWQQGDLRRPYPTDIEMRLGYLGKSDLSNVNGHTSQSQNATTSEFPKPPVGGKYEQRINFTSFLRDFFLLIKYFLI